MLKVIETHRKSLFTATIFDLIDMIPKRYYSLSNMLVAIKF